MARSRMGTFEPMPISPDTAAGNRALLARARSGDAVATGSIAGGMPVTRLFPDSISWPVVVSPVLVTRSFYVVWSREKPSSSEPGLCYQIVPTIRHSDCIGVWQPVPDHRLGAL